MRFSVLARVTNRVRAKLVASVLQTHIVFRQVRCCATLCFRNRILCEWGAIFEINLAYLSKARVVRAG